MKQLSCSFLAIFLLALSSAAASASERRIAVSAAAHDGLLTARVDHDEVSSIQLQVFERESGRLLFDSGVRVGREITWAPGESTSTEWRYVVKAWDRVGTLLTSQVATSLGPTSIVAIDFETIPEGSLGVGTTIGLVSDLVTVGASGLPSRVHVWGQGTLASLELYGNVGGYGGGLGIWDETGTNTMATLLPDDDGDGADLSVFNASAGDTAVNLPVDSVGASEILGEPGIASLSSSADLTLAIGPQAYLSRTITAPTSGYLVVIGSVELNFQHTTADNLEGYAGVTVDTITLPAHARTVSVTSTMPLSVAYVYEVTSVHTFSVAAGFHSARLMVSRGVFGTVVATDGDLVVFFVPTAYGTVSLQPETESEGAEAEGSDAETERARSIAATQARIEAELAEMRQLIESMRRDQ